MAEQPRGELAVGLHSLQNTLADLTAEIYEAGKAKGLGDDWRRALSVAAFVKISERVLSRVPDKELEIEVAYILEAAMAVVEKRLIETAARCEVGPEVAEVIVKLFQQTKD